MTHAKTTHNAGLPKRITILGAARSGISAARYLHERGVSVFISDTCAPDALEMTLASNGVANLPHEARRHSDRVLECDTIVISPGVPSDLPILRKARRKGIPVWSEIELAFRQSAAPYLAITGSSGKSTTVSMAGSMAKAAGKETVVAGNIGMPLIAVAPQVSAAGLVVAEISSFQLEAIDRFKPAVAGVINLMKNHLDRYPDERAYYAAKKNIARNLDRKCWLVLNGRDRILRAWGREFEKKTRTAYFGARIPGRPCVWHESGALWSTFEPGMKKICDVSVMQVAGPHNYDNASAAAAIARAAGISCEAVASGLASFTALPHRLQFVAECAGVRYYNDSKSTTAESVLCAVTAFGGAVHLIAGGKDKGCDFSIVNDAIRTRVKQVYLIGEAAGRMAGEWQGFTAVRREKTLEHAVRAARAAATSGDVVVLSPGCSSFDMFRNYEERGDAFMTIVRAVCVRGERKRK